MNNREYIRKCDADFKERLTDIADEIVRSFDGERKIRLVSLSGPTCSGKTTAAGMLAEHIEKSGKHVHIISIDDFYYGREYLHQLSKIKGMDGLDYDSEETIDLIALKNFIEEALEAEEAHCPIYDFKKGSRVGYRCITSGENDVFVFEGIQAIYSNVTELLAPYGFISLYIAPLTPISHGENTFLPDEIRFMRRIVRDADKRNTPAEVTMHLWDNVRANEEKNIFPYASSCMYRIDSTHQYELGILKPHLESAFAKIDSSSEHYLTALAILEKMADIIPIYTELIEDGSLYREFV